MAYRKFYDFLINVYIRHSRNVIAAKFLPTGQIFNFIPQPQCLFMISTPLE
jgi:hypothetical protein